MDMTQKRIDQNVQERKLCRELSRQVIARWLPPAHICHPYPSRRVRVIS